jgi:hypothetical protein
MTLEPAHPTSAPTRRANDGPGLATRTVEAARMTETIPIKKQIGVSRLGWCIQLGRE